jgi:hypothetical protein
MIFGMGVFLQIGSNHYLAGTVDGGSSVLKVGDDGGVTESAFLSTDFDGAIGRVR